MERDPYVYYGSDVLQNHHNIREASKLERVEALFVGTTLRHLLVTGMPGELTPTWYRAIHRELFGELYPFAGEYRTMDIAKPGEIQYSDAVFLDSNAEQIFQRLRKQENLVHLQPSEFRTALAATMGDLHVLHPFREGNTRTLQVAAYEIAARAGHCLQWERADPKTIRSAGTEAAIGNITPYERILARIMDRRRFALEQRGYAAEQLPSMIVSSRTEGSARQPQVVKVSGLRDQVQENGDVLYSFAHLSAHIDLGAAFRDCGNHLVLESSAVPAIRAALRYAKTAFQGQAIDLMPTEIVRRDMMREAERLGLNVGKIESRIHDARSL